MDEKRNGNKRSVKGRKPMDKNWRSYAKWSQRISPVDLSANLADALMLHLWLRDEIFCQLTSGSEIKICLALAEQTYGWHRNYVKAPAQKVAERTGLKIDAVHKGLTSLENKGIIFKWGEPGEVQEIGFAVPDPRWECKILQTRMVDEHGIKWEPLRKDDEYLRTMLAESQNAWNDAPNDYEGADREKAVLLRYGKTL